MKSLTPLIAAEGYFFSLDRKEAKDQDKGNASTRKAIHLGALPFVGATAHLKRNVTLSEAKNLRFT